MKLNRNARDLYSEFLDAAGEDRAMMEISYNLGFYATACADAARYAEKVVKARVVSEGKYPSKDHDLYFNIEKLKPFPGKEEALELANTLTQYATQASYPTKLRSSITKETADIIIEHAMRVVDLMGIYAPSKTYQVRFGDKNRKSRRHGFWHRR